MFLPHTVTGSGSLIGSLYGEDCYEDSVTIPVVHMRNSAHGNWIKARMAESDFLKLRLRRKGRELKRHICRLVIVMLGLVTVERVMLVCEVAFTALH